MSDSKYTKPELRERLKKRIMAGSRGGKPGQWSARKAQILAQEYEREGGGYRGPKSGKQRSLSKWTDEEWTTSDGKPAIRKGGTNRYLPKKAWSKLTPGQRAATNRKKREASRSGRQFVANTEAARRAGARARSGKSDLPVATPVLGGPERTKWDERVAARLAVMNMRSDQISERVGVDVKALRKLNRIKPSSLSPGARNALSSGAAILDELGFMRCPPGTANAMQFTDFRGSNCGTPNAPGKRQLRFVTEQARREFGSEVIRRRSSFVADRLRQQGINIPGPDKRRKRLADSVRRLFGDSGKVDDNQVNLAEIIKEYGGGFSWNLADGSIVDEGYAIARPGRGFRLRVDGMLDEDGRPTEEARTRLAQMVALNATDFTTPATVDVDGKKVKASSTVLGGWKSDKAHGPDGELIMGDDGQAMSHEDAVAAGMESYEFFYFDMTDIFDEKIGDETAYQIGKDRNQQSIAKLSEINKGNFEDLDIEGIMEGQTGAFIQTEGTGGDLIDVESFDAELANSVSLLGKGGRLEAALRAIAGEDTLDIENFNDAQISAMMRYLSGVKGFEWVDPDNPDHIYQALMQLSDNLMLLMREADPEQREKWSKWYNVANRFSENLAEELGIPTQSMAAITAILSPQKDWDQNMAMAEHLARLMADPDFVIPDDVAIRSAAYELQQWQQRIDPEKRGSYEKSIAKIKQNIAVDSALLKELKKEFKVKPNKRLANRIASAEARLLVSRENLADIQQRIKEDKVKPTPAMFAGKRLSELPDNLAAVVIRAHGEMYGGQYIGQDPLELDKGLSKKDIRDGVFPTRLATWSVTPLLGGEDGDYDVVRGDTKVAATSFPTYEAAVKAFRSGGDMSEINELLGSGSKVRSFYNNIAMPDDETHRDVTVDTHAIAGLTLIPVGASHLVTGTAFNTVASLGTGQVYPIYRTAMIVTALRWAEETGEEYLPRQVQSITWESIRALIKTTSKKEPFISRMAQLQRLSHGPDADPRYSGENMWKVAMEYINIANMSAEDVKKAYKKSKTDAMTDIAKSYGLPAMITAADKMPRAKKGEEPKEG